jgi:hypothetical protein
MFRNVTACTIVCAAIVVLCGCSATAPTPKKPSTFSIHGSFVYGMGSVTRAQFPAGTACDWEDPLEGKQVVILNQSSMAIQTGKLGSGTTVYDDDQAECSFTMGISRIPSDSKLYKLRIDGYKDSPYYSKSELSAVEWHGSKE